MKLPDLTFVRTYDAPRELVFDVWTNSKHVREWWGPKGFTNPVCIVEPHVGGKFHVHMQWPDGPVIPGGGEIREIVKPSRLVFSSTAEDDKGNRLLEALNTVTFVEKNGKTEVTLHAKMIFLAPGMEQAAEGMEEGWSQSLEKLAAYIASITK
jgi:uncharacterized protein YndB with AHSA1/START domain